MTERGSTHMHFFYLLVYSPVDITSSCSPTWVSGAQILGSSFTAFLGTIARNWMGNKAVKIQIGFWFGMPRSQSSNSIQCTRTLHPSFSFLLLLLFSLEKRSITVGHSLFICSQAPNAVFGMWYSWKNMGWKFHAAMYKLIRVGTYAEEIIVLSRKSEVLEKLIFQHQTLQY